MSEPVYRVYAGDPDDPWPGMWDVPPFAGPGLHVWQHLADLSGDAFKIVALIAASRRHHEGVVTGMYTAEARALVGVSPRRFKAALDELLRFDFVELWGDDQQEPFVILTEAKQDAIAYMAVAPARAAAEEQRLIRKEKRRKP
jgi:hypothetical protein